MIDYGETQKNFFRVDGQWYCSAECGSCVHRDTCEHIEGHVCGKDEEGKKKCTLPDGHTLGLKDVPSMRRAFRARPGWKWVSMDYSAVEIRIPANMSGERTWIDSLVSGEDVHLATARLIFKNPALDKKSPERQKAKAANFSLLYGGSPKSLADVGNLPIYEAEQLHSSWWASLKYLREWVRKSQQNALSTGFVRTYFGRTRRFKELFDYNKGFGLRSVTSHQVQGTASDIMKLSMVKIAHPKIGVIAKRGWKDKCRLLFSVHDELNLEVREDSVEEIVPVLVDTMTFKTPEWPVPLTVEYGVGEGWDVK